MKQRAIAFQSICYPNDICLYVYFTHFSSFSIKLTYVQEKKRQILWNDAEQEVALRT